MQQSLSIINQNRDELLGLCEDLLSKFAPQDTVVERIFCNGSQTRVNMRKGCENYLEHKYKFLFLIPLMIR